MRAGTDTGADMTIFIPGVSVLGVSLEFQEDHATDDQKSRGVYDWRPAVGIVNHTPRADGTTPDPGVLDHCVPVVDAPLAQTLSRGTASTQSGSVFVPRDSGVRDNMRFFYQGTWFGIVGDQRWDYPHALTGEDYGYIEFTIRKGG